MATCARNPHMTGLHCIQVVDHFKKWTILVLNRNVLGIWSVELLSDFLSAFCPRVGGGKMRLYGLLGGGNEIYSCAKHVAN